MSNRHYDPREPASNDPDREPRKETRVVPAGEPPDDGPIREEETGSTATDPSLQPPPRR